LARKVEYDKKFLLETAMNIFWAKGYLQTHIQDIVKATNIKPGSIYAAYKNKEVLFQAAMNLYYKQVFAEIEEYFNDDISAEDKIKRFFSHFMFEVISAEDKNGCLLVKTLMSLPDQDEEIRDFAVSKLDKLEAIFLETLKDSTKLTIESPELASKLLMTMIFGLHTYRKNSSHQEIVDIVTAQIELMFKG